MFAPDYSNNLASNESAGGSAAHEVVDRLLSQTLNREEVLNGLPFKVRVLLKAAHADFSFPSAMQHLSHPEEYIRLAKDLTLQGDPQRSPILCVGGFGTTGQGSCNAFAAYVNAEGRGPIVRVMSLEGHDGSWQRLLRIKSSDWIEGVSRHANELYELTNRAVTCVAISTGGLALLGAMKRDPHLFSEHGVGIGVPLELRHATWKLALNLLDKWESNGSHHELLDGFHVANPTVTINELAPVFTRMPVNALIQFNRLRHEIAREEVLASLSKKMLFLHGAEDSLADPVGGMKLVGRSGNGNLVWDPVLKEGGHNLFHSAVRERVFERLLSFCAM